MDKVAIFQNENGSLQLNVDCKKDTIWANLNQIAQMFDRDKSVISKHIKNIFKDNELEASSVVAFFATTATDGKTYNVEYFNLDLILSVGYRVNSKNATKFRQWANSVLKDHIAKGYSINENKFKNPQELIDILKNLKTLLPKDFESKNQDIMDLMTTFTETFFSLNKYDKDELPTIGNSESDVILTSNEFQRDLEVLKKELIEQNEATDLFAKERESGNLENIFMNIYQSFADEEVYKTIEEKSANLIYFIVKNHPFFDGNKRSGAWAFVWFLNKYKILDKNKINYVSLTTLTLLIAISNPQDKNKIIGLILELLK